PVPSTSLQPGSIGFGSLSNAAADFGARSMLLAVRSLAKNLRGIPGRKMVVLFSGGFPPTTENQSELTATISACNQANVAIYALDARGLMSGAPTIGSRAMAQNRANSPRTRGKAGSSRARRSYSQGGGSTRGVSSRAQHAATPGRIVLASYPLASP